MRRILLAAVATALLQAHVASSTAYWGQKYAGACRERAFERCGMKISCDFPLLWSRTAVFADTASMT